MNARPRSLLVLALRRDRLFATAGLVTATLVAWGYLLAGAGMRMHDMDGMLMAASPMQWTPGYAALVFAMWAVMMAAMMLPSAAPTILLYGAIARGRASKGAPIAPTGVFAAGYLAAWTGFSLAAAAAQYVLEEAALLSPMMQATSRALAAGVLIGAGLYQWTPLKQACLRHCRSPLDFVMTYWREGARGAFVMGLRHGAYCLGCCWVLMLLLFVGGVMNLAWIAALATYVLVEKLAPAGAWVSRLAGVMLAGWGIFVLIGLFTGTPSP